MYVLVPKNDTHNRIDVLLGLRFTLRPGLTQYGHSHLDKEKLQTQTKHFHSIKDHAIGLQKFYC